MKLGFTTDGWEHYRYWIDHDKQMLKRLNRIIDDCLRSPYGGIGKPEALHMNLAGWWSRRIDGEHRLVYRVAGTKDDPVLEIAQCRFHY